MGTRGPVPKRSDAVAGHKTKAEKPDKVKVSGKVKAPPPRESWTEAAQEMYRAMIDSGQTQFYEPADWAYLRDTLDIQTRLEQMSRLSAPLLVALDARFARLAVTEVDRRRARIEVDRDSHDQPKTDAVKERITKLRAV